MKSILTATLLAVLPALAQAHDYTAGMLEIVHPYAFEAPASARSAAGYLEITNRGDAPDSLTGIEADFPKVMIHESRESDGVATMTHVERLEIAPGETVTFAPGGYHVMFMGLEDGPFTAGAQIPATLVFEKAGRIEVDFSVEKRGDAAHDGARMGDHASH